MNGRGRKQEWATSADCEIARESSVTLNPLSAHELKAKKRLGGWAVLGGVIHSFRCTKGMWGPRASVGFRDEFLEAESCDLTGLKAQKLYVRNVSSKFLLQ